MKSPKIVITGGLGFIFSYVTEYFVQKGWDVVVIDNLSVGAHPEILDGSFVHHNMHTSNPAMVDLIIKEAPDYLVHAAAITDVDYSIQEPRRTIEKNTLGMLHAFEAARQLPYLKKFMYVGTDEIYGECERPMREDDIILPKSPYSASKAMGSLVRVAYENTFPQLKEKTVETRMCNIFGARQDTRKIMPQIKKSLESGYSIPLHQGGKGYREFVYVKNIPPIVELILSEGTGIYNISMGEGLTVTELVAKAEALTGKKVTTHTADRPGMDQKYEVDSSRVYELGWKPLYTFEEGFKEYLTEQTGVEEKKRTLVIGTNDLLMGGAQRLVIDQLRNIDRTVFDIHLIVLMEFEGKATFADLVPDDVTVHTIAFKGFRDIRKWLKLFFVLKTIQPDIVKTALFFSNTVFLLLKPFFRYVVIAAEHNTVNVKPLWQRVVDRVLLPRTYTVVADSKAVVDFVVETEGIARKHFTVIYNGVDLVAVSKAKDTYVPEKTSIRKEYDIPADATVILNVGWLIYQKNPQLMIESFAKLYERYPNLYLVMVGGGKFEKELAQMVTDLGLSSRVRLLGEQKNVHKFYAIADVFILTSRHEGFCIAAMEALAFGMPLISTRVAGVSEYLKDGESGFFVDPTAEDVSSKLERVITFTSDEKAAFATAGQETAGRYSTARYAAEFTALLRRIVGGMNYAEE